MKELVAFCFLSVSLWIVGADNICGDKRTTCPDGMTCCEMSGGQWGCCPFPNAVCCPDKVHCCPESTTCNEQEQTCDHSNNERPRSSSWSTPNETKVICDKSSKVACPDGTTCCKMGPTQWGCCPIPHAVCCNDNMHCCPAGTTCDVAEGKCIQQFTGLRMRWVENAAATKIKDVECPDKNSTCPDETTCCQMPDLSWGCCPIPDAVCCSDKIHCCPDGTTCNVQQGTCEQTNRNNRTPWFKKFQALKKEQSIDVHCPDPSKVCQDGETCCKLGDPPTWGCCPLPHATCCPDHIHCCPSGSKCNNESICETNILRMRVSASVIKAVKKPPPLFPLGDMECPDRRTACVGDQVSCCQMPQGKWGCCPFANAVCCANLKYCCPANTTCSMLRDQCYKSDGEIVQAETIAQPALHTLGQLLPMPSFTVPNSEPGSYACDNTNSTSSRCLDKTTCCQTDSGYGCCPHKGGQCCADRKHCCPLSSTCDNAKSKCSTRSGSFDWSLISQTAVLSEVQCTDGLHSCLSGKCCKNNFGSFSCCPDPLGFCCWNGRSCCPNGFVCQLDGTCSAFIDKDE